MITSWLFMPRCFAAPRPIACMELTSHAEGHVVAAARIRSMKKPKPTTRSEASAPEATKHLDEGQKQALDHQADAEHTDGPEREKLTEKIKQEGD